MKALLLAAGMGSRLRPLTDTIPKCLVPIKGRPLMGYWLDMLVAGGVSEILINTHYLARQVCDYIAASPYRDNVTLVHEDVLLGTAGTLLKNQGFFGQSQTMLIHADNLSSFDMRSFVNRHESRPNGCEMTMMTFETPTPHSCGIVELDSIGVVQQFYEKVSTSPGNLANGAVYILQPSVYDFLSGLNKIEIDFSTEVLPNYLGKIYTFFNNKYHRDIGTMESYLAAESEFVLK